MSETTIEVEGYTPIDEEQFRLESREPGWEIWYAHPRHLYITLEGDEQTEPFSQRLREEIVIHPHNLSKEIEFHVTVDAPELGEILARVNPHGWSFSGDKTNWGKLTLAQAYTRLTQATVSRHHSFNYRGCGTDEKKAKRLASEQAWAEVNLLPGLIKSARGKSFVLIQRVVEHLNQAYMENLKGSMGEEHWDWSDEPTISYLLHQEQLLKAELHALQMKKQSLMRQHASQWADAALLPPEARLQLQAYLAGSGFKDRPFLYLG